MHLVRCTVVAVGAHGVQNESLEPAAVAMRVETDEHVMLKVMDRMAVHVFGAVCDAARKIGTAGAAILAAVALAGCGLQGGEPVRHEDEADRIETVLDRPYLPKDDEPSEGGIADEANPEPSRPPDAESLRADLNIIEDYRESFVHGEKDAEHQKYIMLHDTEGDSPPQSVIDFWDGNGNLVAAHFIVGTDGAIAQCVPLDSIAHHAGFGDTGHNTLYGVEDESRDDKLGTVPIGDWAADYGMNSYSVGIEMVHVGGSGDYPQEQLQAVDALIAYIDAYYGFESEIIDHKAWRSGNSDTSAEFAGYYENYRTYRTHASGIG